MSEKLQSLAPLALRCGLGVVFIYHGFGKAIGEATSWGSAWMPGDMPAIIQILVSWGELIGGTAILLGFMTTPAAIGIIIIMIGAIVTVHGKNGFGMMNQGFEYNFVLITMCLALISTKSGPYSLKCLCIKKK